MLVHESMACMDFSHWVWDVSRYEIGGKSCIVIRSLDMLNIFSVENEQVVKNAIFFVLAFLANAVQSSSDRK